MRRLEEEVIFILKERGFILSSAESCTGGMLISTLINVSGASEVIKEGIVTYANEAKMKYLGVKKETLLTYSAVSKETAIEMVEGLEKITNAQVTVSTTGYAGPEGGTLTDPVGTVYVGCSVNGCVYVKRFFLSGSRYEIRCQAVEQALRFVLECIRTN